MQSHAIPSGHQVFTRLFTSPFLQFESIASELLRAGIFQKWYEGEILEEKLLGKACEYALGNMEAKDDFLIKLMFSPKSSFDAFTKVAYLIRVVDLAVSSIDPDWRIHLNKIYENLSESIAYLFVHDTEALVLQIARHLHQPYRVFVFVDMLEKILDNKNITMKGLHDINNLLLISLTTDNITKINPTSLLNYFQSATPRLEKRLMPDEMNRLNLSVAATLEALGMKNPPLDYKPCDEPVYRNFSGARFDDRDQFIFDDGRLAGSNFTKTRITQLRLTSANLKAANFSNLSFDPAYDHASLSLESADLTGALFCRAHIHQIDFTDTILDHTDFRHARILQGYNFHSRLAKAKSLYNISFRFSLIYYPAFFKGVPLSSLDLNSCQVDLEGRIKPIQQALSSVSIEPTLAFLSDSDSELLYFFAELYLAYLPYHERTQQLFNRMLSDQHPMHQHCINQLNQKQQLEIVRLNKLSEALTIFFQLTVDLKKLITFRLLNQSLKKIIDRHLEARSLQVLDHCLHFASTDKLNKAALFFQSIGIIDKWATTPRSGYTRLFAKLMQYRLNQPVRFNTVLDAEVNALTAQPHFTFRDLHRLIYLTETICSDDPLLDIPIAMRELIAAQSLWNILDEVVQSINVPAKLFRLHDLLYSSIFNRVEEEVSAVINDGSIIKKLPTESTLAAMMLYMLFSNIAPAYPLTDEVGIAHQIKAYIHTHKAVFVSRYGILNWRKLKKAYTSYWDVPKKIVNTPQEIQYINLIGVHLAAYYSKCAGGNMAAATIFGGMHQHEVNLTECWLKCARFIAETDYSRNLHKLLIRSSNLSLAKFNGVDIRGSNFKGSDLRHITCDDACDTRDIKLVGAVVNHSALSPEMLRAPVLSQSQAGVFHPATSTDNGDRDTATSGRRRPSRCIIF